MLAWCCGDCVRSNTLLPNPSDLASVNTFTKSARAKINAASILISDALAFGRLWYGEPNAVANAIGYAEHDSRSHDALVRVYDDAAM